MGRFSDDDSSAVIQHDSAAERGIRICKKSSKHRVNVTAADQQALGRAKIDVRTALTDVDLERRGDLGLEVVRQDPPAAPPQVMRHPMGLQGVEPLKVEEHVREAVARWISREDSRERRAGH